jgi:hypothetical protein
MHAYLLCACILPAFKVNGLITGGIPNPGTRAARAAFPHPPGASTTPEAGIKNSLAKAFALFSIRVFAFSFVVGSVARSRSTIACAYSCA